MNILFVSAVMPYPLHSGGQVRIYNILKKLSKHHDITLCTFVRSESELKYQKDLSFCKKIHCVYRGKALQGKYLFKAFFSSMPWLLATYDNDHMRTIIHDELKHHKYDLVHIEPFYVYPSLPKTSLPLVVAEHNIEYSVYQQYVDRFPMPLVRPILRLDVNKIKTWEHVVWDKAKKIIAVSNDDQLVIRNHDGSKNVTVAPNGVASEEFKVNTQIITEKRCRCLYVGNFSWLPNVEAAQKLIQVIWPKIHTKYKNAELSIVGKNMPSSIRSNPEIGIIAKGEVENIAEVLSNNEILLAPMTIGGGTKFKILEAMATGVIILSSKEGVMGLPVTSKKEVIICETPDDYVNSLGLLIKDNSLVSSLRQEARSLIERSYTWDAIASLVDTVWKEACV